MPASVLAEALAQPATTLLAVFLCCVFALLHALHLGYADVGLSYSSAMRGELWRCAACQVCHVDLIHLLFNLSALWSIGLVERTAGLGSLYYLQHTALFFMLSPAICLVLNHLLITVGRREELRDVTALGYSCVLFAWMTLLATNQPGGISMLPLFGLASVPAWLTPWASLLITSLLIPRASFVGHLAGILAGYCVAFHLFSWLSPFWTLSLLLWVALGIAYAAARSQQLSIPYIRLPGGAAGLSPLLGGSGDGGSDPELGGGGGSGAARIVNGLIVRS